MDTIKRSYYLPAKLIAAFHKEAQKSGYVKEKVAAAAIHAFLESDANARAKMFDRMATFLSKKGK